MARRATRALGDNCQPPSPNRQGAITVTDDETQGIVRATTLAALEASRATYEVKLASQPVGSSVTVTLTGTGLTADTDGDTTGDQTTLAFATADWNTNQTVTARVAASRHAATPCPYSADAGRTHGRDSRFREMESATDRGIADRGLCDESAGSPRHDGRRGGHRRGDAGAAGERGRRTGARNPARGGVGHANDYRETRPVAGPVRVQIGNVS